MQATGILPDLQCSLLCEESSPGSQRELFDGVINFIRVPQLPVTAFKLMLFNRWTAGVGQFVETRRRAIHTRQMEASGTPSPANGSLKSTEICRSARSR